MYKMLLKNIASKGNIAELKRQILNVVIFCLTKAWPRLSK